MIYPRAFPFFLLLFLSSCFRSADKDKAALLSSPPLHQIAKAALSQSSSFNEGSLDRFWWKSFGEEDLDLLIEKALANSPTLKLAEAKIVTAQAAVKAVRSQLFPQLSMDATDNWNYLSRYGFDRDFFPLPANDVIPSKFNETDLSLNFSYEFDFWGKNRKKLREALGIALAEQMEKNQAELVLCETVAYAYFQWQAHTAAKQMYEKWLEAEEKLSDLFSSRYENGIDNILPPLRQKEELASIKQKLIETQKEQEIDLLFLKNLIGAGPEEPLSLTAKPELLSQTILLPENLGIDLLSQRPDLMSLIWKVSAAAEAIGVAKTEFYPNVSLSALAGLSSLTFNHLFDWASRTGSLVPAIHLPLFTGGALTANLNTKVSLFNEAVHVYNEQLLKAAQEVAQEITTFISLEKQKNEQDQIVDLQEKSYEITHLRYTQGLDPYASVLIASQTLFLQEVNAIYAKHCVILSSLRVIQSLGGGIVSTNLPSLTSF